MDLQRTMSARDAALPLLRSVPFFAGLDSAVLKAIAGHCRSKIYSAGQNVFMLGDPCLDLCILESGRVMFYRINAEGREQVLRVFERPGDTFCIPSAFSTGRYIVNIKAAIDTRLRLLSMDTVNHLMQDHPSIGLKLVATAGGHMAQLVTLAEDLALKTATGRLAKYLHEIAVGEGAAKSEHVRIPRSRLPEDELASILGTVRVNISRGFANLAQAGAIEVDRKFIRILNLPALGRISEGR